MRPHLHPSSGASARALRGPLLLPLILVFAGCGAPARERTLPPAAVDVAATAPPNVDGVDSSLLPEAGATSTDLGVLYPELVELDSAYRQTLQAMREDDLPGAEEALAHLEEELQAAQRQIGPPASLYVDSMGGRVERLRGLVQELRDYQRSMSDVAGADAEPDGSEADSVALAELHALAQKAPPSGPRHDLELVDHPLVDRWERYFTGDGRHYMELWLSRQPLYEDFIHSILDEYDVPRDLLYLAMIESGLSMKARSYANAVGPWQFISSTGRLYGLKIDWWVDERRDLEKATRAAASHLSDLYESLHSWPLALAAYNCGIRRVERATRRHHTTDFWKLSSLPRQTRNYVPKFMAALRIGKNPAAYGMAVPERPPLSYDVVHVDDATDLNLVATLAGTSLETLTELNPHLKRWATPPGEPYRILVPAGTGDSVAVKLAGVPAEERVRWRRHRVGRGETLAGIARDYGTSADAVRQANNMRGSTIHPGNYLLIPVVGGTPGALAQQSIAHAAKVNTAEEASVYIVRRGDTLGRIAKRHGVTVRQLMRWNGKSSTRIHAGDRLRLHAGETTASARVASVSSDDEGRRHITYVVQRGDTLSAISERHRVSIKQLMSWNRKHSSRIRVGERLRIYLPS